MKIHMNLQLFAQPANHTGATGMGIGSLKLDGCGIAAKCAVITACVSCHYDNLTLQRATDAVLSVLPLDEAVEMLQAGRLPARAVCLTFDDGYRDNHDIALPLLQRHGLTPWPFITRHVEGDWGDLDAEDAALNRAAVTDGSRILSAYAVEGSRLWVITDAVHDEDGNRQSTCLLLPEEY